jgi:hypothetical protein
MAKVGGKKSLPYITNLQTVYTTSRPNIISNNKSGS